MYKRPTTVFPGAARPAMLAAAMLAAGLISTPCLAAAGLQPAGLQPAGVGVTAGQIDALNSRIVVLKAQLSIAKLKAAIRTAGNPSKSPNAASSPYGLPMGVPAFSPLQGANPTPIKTMDQKSLTLPQVESISGVGRHLSAMVSLPNGGQRIVTVGNRLSGGLVVRSITSDGVNVSGKSGVQSLPFANGSAPVVSSDGGGMGTPPAATPTFASPTMLSPSGMPGVGLPPSGMPPAMGGSGAPSVPGA